MSGKKKEEGSSDLSMIANFVREFPRACEVPEGLDEIEGTRLLGLFNYELENPGSVLRRIPGQSTRQRMAPAVEGWGKFAANKKAMAYGLDLLCYLSDAIDFNKRNEAHPKWLINECARLQTIEQDQPEVKAVAELMTVEWASEQSNWV